jgi:hypothetical protein
MSKVFRIVIIGLGLLVLAGGLLFAGASIGVRAGSLSYWMQPFYRLMGRPVGYGGMMGSGSGMLGGAQRGSNSSSKNLTVDQAFQAAGKYLASSNNPDLKIAEVMVFDNNAYVRVIEKSTGVGAFELLVDPQSLVIYPEPGPNMMWNLKYAGMNQQNMMGGLSGMMGGQRGMMGANPANRTPAAVSASMPLSSAQALLAAQAFLDSNQPGAKTATDADQFYGYYTIDTLRDGQIVGMLSVNGFTGQVFLHTWHGAFVATQDY